MFTILTGPLSWVLTSFGNTFELKKRLGVWTIGTASNLCNSVQVYLALKNSLSSVQFLLSLLATVLEMDLNTASWCDDRTSKYFWLSVGLEIIFVFKKPFSTHRRFPAQDIFSCSFY